MLKSEEIRKKAEKILEKTGLLEELAKYGEVHPIGSYRMDIMAWNDIDMDVRNDGMNLEKLYALTNYVLETFRPVWYEAKEEVNADGKTVWFHGFEAVIDRELWNFDLWFFDEETIAKAEAYCDRIAEMSRDQPRSRDAILAIKQELLRRNLYGFEKYGSMDVYRAVLEQGIRDTDEFLESYEKQENRL